MSKFSLPLGLATNLYGFYLEDAIRHIYDTDM